MSISIYLLIAGSSQQTTTVSALRLRYFLSLFVAFTPSLPFLSFSFFAHFNFSLLPLHLLSLIPHPFPPFSTTPVLFPLSFSRPTRLSFPCRFTTLPQHTSPFSLSSLSLLFHVAASRPSYAVVLFLFSFLCYPSFSLSLLARVGFTDVKAPDQDLDNFIKNKQLPDLFRDICLEKAANNESIYIIYGSKFFSAILFY